MRISVWSSDVCSSDLLESLADALGAKTAEPKLQKLARPDLPTGALNPDSIVDIRGALLPENAIVCDESVTDRKSVVWGKSVLVRVDLGGRRLSNTEIKKYENLYN